MAEILLFTRTLVLLVLLVLNILIMAAMLKEFPPEVRKAVLLKQVEIKTQKKNYKSSQAQALIEIVKEWIEFKNKNH